jgi:hypothetical protein
LAVTGGFGETNRSGDDGAKDLFSEMGAEILTDLLAEAGAGVVHRQNNSENCEGGIVISLFDSLDQAENLSHSLEGKVLALHRNEDFVGGNESTGHEEPHAGWAIEDDEIESGIVAEGCEGIADTEKGVLDSGELHFCSRQIHLGGEDLEVFLAGRLEHVDGTGIPDKDGVKTFTRDDFEPKAAGSVGLGVEIDEENAATCFSDASG